MYEDSIDRMDNPFCDLPAVYFDHIDAENTIPQYYRLEYTAPGRAMGFDWEN